jgi:nicotinamide riboside kinase
VALPSANLLGICGAPSTGKTTLAQALSAELRAAGLSCTLLAEPARELARQGVRIDAAMQPQDYDAFLAAYIARDAGCVGLGIADRTPADHYCYLAVNGGVEPWFEAWHHHAALSALEPYRVLLYLPPELRLVDDRFRITSTEYRQQLDRQLTAFLALSGVPVVEVHGSRAARLAAALAVVHEHWPGLDALTQADASQ